MKKETKELINRGLESKLQILSENNSFFNRQSTSTEQDSFGSHFGNDLLERISDMISCAEKYRFLVKNINDITFKNNLMEYEGQQLVQSIMKDIMSPPENTRSFLSVSNLNMREVLKDIYDSEHKYRFLIEHIGEIVFTCDRNYMFSYLNPQWQIMLGYSVCGSLGKCLFDFIHEDDLPIIKEKFSRLFQKSEKVFNFEYRLKDSKNNWKYHLVTSTPIRNSKGEVVEVIGVSREITKRKLYQEKIRDFNEQLERKVRERTQEINVALEEIKQVNKKLIHSEKMAVVGELASGIAHEFNNLIGIMQAYAEFAKSQSTKKNTDKLIEAVLLSSKRAKTITKGLLSFARRIQPMKERADIHSVIDEVLLLIENEMRKANVTVIKNFDKNIQPVVIDVGQIEQVLLNLLVNAKHALQKKKTGAKITITTFDLRNNIKVIVSDNGAGIKKENLAKIFEPFFTTKGSKSNSKIRGTGLGLSVSQGIIEGHQGSLSVDSEENVGTDFTICLPKKDQPVVFTSPIHIDKNKNQGPPSILKQWSPKAATILVVDDEDYLRRALCDILDSEGYNVVAAEDGETAINLFKSGHFDLVLMDIMMPGIDGFETIKILRNIDPEIKIIILCGTTQAFTKRGFKEAEVQGIIFKPFELEKLLNKLGVVLEEKV